MSQIDDVFADLAPLQRWVPYRIVFNSKREKFDKIPHNGARGLSTKRPEEWTDFVTAATTAQENGLPGVGFVMTDGVRDGNWRLVGIDFDDVVFENFKMPFETYCEVSPSGTGVRGFVWVPDNWADQYQDTTEMHPGACSHAEVYLGTSPRFLTVTFNPLNLKPIARLTRDKLDWLEAFLKKSERVSGVTPATPVLPSDAGTPLKLSKYQLTPEQVLLVDGVGEIDRSAVMHGLLVKLIDAGASREDILATILHSTALWEYCMDHRHHSITRAAEFAREEIQRAYEHSLTGKRERLLGFNKRWRPVEPKVTAKMEEVRVLPFPDQLFENAPGLVGEIAHWIMRASYSPRKEFAYACSLSMVSALIGPYCVHGTRNTKMNLYITLVGETGTGKNEAIDVMGMLMAATEAKDCIMDFPASEAALRRQLNLTPNILIRVDELAHKLESMTNSSNGSGLGRAMLEAYNGARMPPKVYADDKKSLPAVENPYVQILGGTTDKIWSVVKSQHMEDGTLNRFLFICLPENAPYCRDTEPDPTIAKEFKDRLNAFWRNGKRFDLIGFMPPGMGRRVTIPDEVREAAKKLDREVWKLQQLEYGSLYSRFVLHVLKIAAILAVGDNRMVVSMTDYEQAYAFVNWSVTNTRNKVRDNMADTRFEQQTKRLLSFLQKFNGRMTMREAYRAMHISRREMDEVVNTLMLSGDVEMYAEEEDNPVQGGGRTEWLLLCDYTKEKEKEKNKKK